MDDYYKKKPYPGPRDNSPPYLRNKYSYLSEWYWELTSGSLPPGITLTENSSAQGNFYGGGMFSSPRNILNKPFSSKQAGTILEGKPTEVGNWTCTFNLIQQYLEQEPIREFGCGGTASQVRSCMKWWSDQPTPPSSVITEVVGTLNALIEIDPVPLSRLFYSSSLYMFDKGSEVSQNIPLAQKDCVVTGISAVDLPPGLRVTFSTTSSSLINSVSVTGSPTLTGFFASTLTPMNSGETGVPGLIYFKIRPEANFSTSSGSSGSFDKNPSPFVSIYDITGTTGVSGVRFDYPSLLKMTGRDPFFSVSANSLGDFFAASSPCNYQALQIKSANSNKLDTSKPSGFGRLKSFVLRKNGSNSLIPPSGIKIGSDLLSDYNNAFLGSDLSMNSEGNFLVSSLYDNHGITAYVLKEPEKFVLSDPSTLCSNCQFLSSATIDEDVPPPVGFGFGCNLYWNKKKSFPLPGASFDYDPNDDDNLVDVVSDQDIYLYADAIGRYNSPSESGHWCLDWYQETDAVEGVGTEIKDGNCYKGGKQVGMVVSYRKKSQNIKLEGDPVFYVDKIVNIGAPSLAGSLRNNINTEKENGRVASLYNYNFDNFRFYKKFGGTTLGFLLSGAAPSAVSNTLKRVDLVSYAFNADENATLEQLLQAAPVPGNLVDSCVLCNEIKNLTNTTSPMLLKDRDPIAKSGIVTGYCISGTACCNVSENYFWGSDPLCSSNPTASDPIGVEISFSRNGVSEKALLFMVTGVNEENSAKAFDPRAVYQTNVLNGKIIEKSDGYRLLSSNLSDDAKGARAFNISGDLNAGFLALVSGAS
jgi:hypothetical protein